MAATHIMLGLSHTPAIADSGNTKHCPGHPLRDRYSIELARSESEILALRQEWQPLSADPNADLDFYLTVTRSHREVLRPHAIVLRQAGNVKTIVAGRIEEKPLQVAMGYKKVLTRPVRFLMLIHGGVMGEDSEKSASLVLDSIKQTLRVGDADIAWFHGAECTSALCRAASAAGGLLTRDFCPTELTRWRVRIPGTYTRLLEQLSPNTRHNLKRYSKRLQQAFGDQLRVRSFRMLSDVNTVLQDCEQVALNTYHRGLGVGFIANDETRQLMNLAASEQWLRVHILYIADKPVAFWTGFLYRRTFFTWTTGYDPKIANLRPGTFLLQKMFEELCEEAAADEVDFGFGDAQYKQDWCDHKHVQSSFLLFAPTLRGIGLNCFRTPLMGASQAARALLAQAGVLQGLKKVWREKLARQERT